MIYLPFLVFWVGTKCNLRCEGCANLIPYSRQESYFADFIIEDLKKVLEYSSIDSLQVQGGEPFTHPEINKIIEAVNKFQIKNIYIATNGVVKLKKDTLDILRKSNLRVRVSYYDCVESKQKEFCNSLIDNEIEIFGYDWGGLWCKKAGFWINQGGPEQRRNDDNSEVQKIYSDCAFKYCVTLADGKFFRCGRGKVSTEIFSLNCTENDFVDIRKGEAIREKLDIFLKSEFFKNYCRYCLGTKDREFVPTAKQI